MVVSRRSPNIDNIEADNYIFEKKLIISRT
jgi:hypothetical protein